MGKEKKVERGQSLISVGNLVLGKGMDGDWKRGSRKVGC